MDRSHSLQKDDKRKATKTAIARSRAEQQRAKHGSKNAALFENVPMFLQKQCAHVYLQCFSVMNVVIRTIYWPTFRLYVVSRSLKIRARLMDIEQRKLVGLSLVKRNILAARPGDERALWLHCVLTRFNDNQVFLLM